MNVPLGWLGGPSLPWFPFVILNSKFIIPCPCFSSFDFLPPCCSLPRPSATRMAHNSQHQHGNSAHETKSLCGVRQAVFELCEITSSGLVFWSRRRFDIGSEMQVRMHHSALPAGWRAACMPGDGQWVMLKGLVVACAAVRRSDGSSGFEVSLLVDEVPKVRSKMRWSRPRVSGLKAFGLN